MRDQDMRDRLACRRTQDRVNMLIKQRTGIDDGNLSAPDDVGAGPVKRERIGVAGQNATNTRHHLHGMPIDRIIGPVHGKHGQ